MAQTSDLNFYRISLIPILQGFTKTHENGHGAAKLAQ